MGACLATPINNEAACGRISHRGEIGEEGRRKKQWWHKGERIRRGGDKLGREKRKKGEPEMGWQSIDSPTSLLSSAAILRG